MVLIDLLNRSKGSRSTMMGIYESVRLWPINRIFRDRDPLISIRAFDSKQEALNVLRPMVMTISALFRPRPINEFDNIQNVVKCVEELQREEKTVLVPMLMNAGDHPYLKKLLDIKLYLDLDLLFYMGFGTFLENEIIFGKGNHTESWTPFSDRVRFNGLLSMRDFCEKTSSFKIETPNKSVVHDLFPIKYSEMERGIIKFTKIKILHYVLNNCKKRRTISNGINYYTCHLYGKETLKFIEVILSNRNLVLRK